MYDSDPVIYRLFILESSYTDLPWTADEPDDETGPGLVMTEPPLVIEMGSCVDDEYKLSGDDAAGLSLVTVVREVVGVDVGFNEDEVLVELAVLDVGGGLVERTVEVEVEVLLEVVESRLVEDRLVDVVGVVSDWVVLVLVGLLLVVVVVVG